MKLETDRGHFFVDGVRRTDITQEEFDEMLKLEYARRHRGTDWDVNLRDIRRWERPLKLKSAIKTGLSGSDL